MDTEHRFLMERGALPAPGNEGGSGTGLIMLLVTLLIGLVVEAAVIVIFIPDSPKVFVLPGAAAALPDSAQARAPCEQFSTQAGAFLVDARVH